MALKEMNRIGEEAKSKWHIHRLVVQHVTGEKMPGEPVVLIGVTAAHRIASFQGCQFMIDELKKSVPIWKKNFMVMRVFGSMLIHNS